MTFKAQNKQLKEQCQLPQWKVVEALGIDSATYCKIEKGERRAKCEEVVIIAELLNIYKGELLTLFVDRIVEVVENE
ncbi:hypothetical protein FACS1894199_01730 [Bacteroidia bacterium]|nr:hypothetical protein FACS1894199_01730 [Bacteroidia bacterium]